MAELVTIDGHPYLKRNPLGVLGLSIITLGIYWIVWYYKINVEIQRAENDQTMSPMRSLMAMIFGWLIIVPPFIAITTRRSMCETWRRAWASSRRSSRRSRSS